MIPSPRLLLACSVALLSACSLVSTTNAPTKDRLPPARDAASEPKIRATRPNAPTPGAKQLRMDAAESSMANNGMAPKNDAAMAAGTYADFTSDVIGNGQTSVLFFYAAWCPYCREDDGQLAQWYAANHYAVSTYKVDYDTAQDLREKYAVTSQHTYVLIDGDGHPLKRLTNFPSDKAVQTLLKEAA